MRYIELLEAVDINFIRNLIRKVAVEALKGTIKELERYGPKDGTADDWSEYLHNENGSGYLSGSKKIYYFTNTFSEALANEIHAYLLKKYSKSKNEFYKIKRLRVYLRFDNKKYYDYDHKTRLGDARIDHGYLKGEDGRVNFYNINLSTNFNKVSNLINNMSSSYFVDQSRWGDLDYQDIIDGCFEYSTFIHELEHIEQFIKTEDDAYYNSAGHRTSIMKGKGLSVNEIEKISRNPSEGNLNRFLYYTSNLELDTFTTQAVDWIFSDYSEYDIRWAMENTQSFLINLLKANEHVLRVVDNIDYAYERLDDSEKTDKLKGEIAKIKQYVYKVVIRKLFKEMDKVNPTGLLNPVQKFTTMTGKFAALGIASKALDAVLKKEIDVDIRFFVEYDKIDALVDSLIWSQNSYFDEIEEAVNNLSPKIRNNPVIQTRIDKFKERIGEILRRKIGRYKEQYAVS